MCIKEEKIKQGSGKGDVSGERGGGRQLGEWLGGPHREGTLNKELRSVVHVYLEQMLGPMGANSRSWHRGLMKTKSHADAKGQEYCFWLLKSTESVGFMSVLVVSLRLEMGSSLTAIFDIWWGGRGSSFRRLLTSHPADLTNFCQRKVMCARDYSCSLMG